MTLVILKLQKNSLKKSWLKSSETTYKFKKIPAKPAKGRPYILKLFADMVTAIKEFFLGSQCRF